MTKSKTRQEGIQYLSFTYYLCEKNMLIDTHAHLYSEDFDDDRDLIISNAIEAGVKKIVLPNIDEKSIGSMLALRNAYPGICYPLMGLHPTSVGKNYKEQLLLVQTWLEKETFYGIGEIGIDLYWDKTYLHEQQEAFRTQLGMARAMHLPVVIHVRNSFDEVYSILSEEQDGNLKGVFHCFSGSENEAQKITDIGFYMGIGGVVTFKNSNLPEVLKKVNINHLLLETDAPYLAPMPHRGRRNESAYLLHIADKLAGIYETTSKEVEQITTANAKMLFGI
jgi:TatD DNase family protein